MSDGVSAYLAHGADIVVAVGGGSPLDVGKLVALKVTHDRPLADYDDAAGGDKRIGPNVPPIITVPTTAGTGTEVTRNAVLGSHEHRVKVSMRSPFMLPRVAIVDPELTLGLPMNVTAFTGSGRNRNTRHDG